MFKSISEVRMDGFLELIMGRENVRPITQTTRNRYKLLSEFYRATEFSRDYLLVCLGDESLESN